MSVRLLRGDCRDVLDTLPEGSVQCCVTSPPYWGLRSYLPADHPLKHREIGSEPTVDEWVQTMVDVFAKVRRVLRDDGVLFLNLGDAYVHGTGADRGPTTTAGQHVPASWSSRSQPQRIRPSDGLKTKDLIGQPWMVAFALRADGWWLRQEIIWSKDNPMPESVRDRCTKSHEHIFLLSKSDRYFWAFDAVQEPVNGGAHARRPDEYSNQKRPGFGHGYDDKPKPRYKTEEGWSEGRPSKYGTLTGQDCDGAHRTKAGLNRKQPDAGDVGRRYHRKLAEPGSGTKNNASMDEALADVRSTRNPRSVWTFPTEPFSGAHFATFPRELARRCILAGSSAGDTVLDPFGGSGTVGMVADAMHRAAILIDIDERNLPMARERIEGDAPLFATVEAQ